MEKPQYYLNLNQISGINLDTELTSSRQRKHTVRKHHYL